MKCIVAAFQQVVNASSITSSKSAFKTGQPRPGDFF